jgi:hypothetical protein
MERLLMTTQRDDALGRDTSPGVLADAGPAEVPESDGYVCRWSPSTCMDDLCRNSSIGICGNVDPEDEDDFSPWDDDDHPQDWFDDAEDY